MPNILPPSIEWNYGIISLLEKASRAVGILDGYVSSLPEPDIILEHLLRNEAVMSSRIEGTQSTLEDLLLFEVTGKQRVGDEIEVSNYFKAFKFTAEQVQKSPFSIDLALEAHRILMENVMGKEKEPGKIRKMQVFIGTQQDIRMATYVSPPPKFVEGLLENLIEFWRNDDMPNLAKAAIIHYQFEAIHPFRDGNGRIGCLLIPIFLMEKGTLKNSNLHLSSYFAHNR